MADKTLPPDPPDDRAEAAALRQALGAMRREAELEVERISLRLREGSAASAGDGATAAERLALEQTLETLRLTLSAKEQALETITSECRRLEDALEDQHLVFDGLRREVERRDVSLQVAEQEVERLRQALLDVQSRAPERPPSESRPVQPIQPPAARASRRSSLLWVWPLVLIAIILVGGLVYWLVLDRADSTGTPPQDSSPVPEPASQRDERVPRAIPLPPEDAPEPSDAPTTAALSTVRDRLSDGSSGPTLARLPGGTFRMGHNLTTANDFGPAREVRIAPFLMGVHEVTFEQYDRFARATGRGLPSDQGWGRGTRPVIGVSWLDARDYAAWLARQTGQPYRLPSEAEWEYAARAGGRGSYWWGFGLEPGRAVCFDCGSPWDNRSTAPVGSLEPSAFGLHDTAGNVMEWVEDCYQRDYRGAPSDGRARLDGPCTERVARGGAFNKPSASMRAYVREHFAPETRLNALGFRVARDL